MKLFIPACGHRIKLIKDWSFTLYYERRNDDLLKILLPTDFASMTTYWCRFVGGREHPFELKRTWISLPTSTVLEVDRVYIRQTNKSASSKEDDYDSISFRIIEHPTIKKKRPRFWSKLSDVNEIEYELPENFDETKLRLGKENKT
jgi:hypothetical protein